MPSSTSNSKERVPDGRWALTWVSALVLLVLALAGWKLFWTSRGYGVSLPNSAASWAAKRVDLRPESTVFLGTSRIQVGLVPDEWAAVTGGKTPVQLALAGTSPVKTLRHLADDTDFHGLAIVGIVAMYTFDVEAHGTWADEALAEYRAIQTGPAKRAGVELGRFVPTSLLMRNEHLDLSGILDGLWNGRPPKNPPACMQPSRWIEYTRARLDTSQNDYTEFENAGRPAPPAERDSIIADIRTSIETIRGRGGTVVLVSFPACGRRREIEDRRYPRALYWDPLVRAVAPVPAIRCYDIPSLMDFTCADGSHLDKADARRFTRELARIVMARLQ